MILKYKCRFVIVRFLFLVLFDCGKGFLKDFFNIQNAEIKILEEFSKFPLALHTYIIRILLNVSLLSLLMSCCYSFE